MKRALDPEISSQIPDDEPATQPVVDSSQSEDPLLADVFPKTLDIVVNVVEQQLKTFFSRDYQSDLKDKLINRSEGRHWFGCVSILKLSENPTPEVPRLKLNPLKERPTEVGSFSFVLNGINMRYPVVVHSSCEYLTLDPVFVENKCEPAPRFIVDILRIYTEEYLPKHKIHGPDVECELRWAKKEVWNLLDKVTVDEAIKILTENGF